MEDRNRPDTSGEDRGSKGRDFRRKTNHNDDDNEKIGEAPRTPQPDSPINPYYDSHGTSTSNRGSNNIFQQVRSGMPKFSLPNKTSFTLPPAATNLFNFGKRGSGNSINSPPVTEAAASTSVEMGQFGQNPLLDSPTTAGWLQTLPGNNPLPPSQPPQFLAQIDDFLGITSTTDVAKAAAYLGMAGPDDEEVVERAIGLYFAHQQNEIGHALPPPPPMYENNINLGDSFDNDGEDIGRDNDDGGGNGGFPIWAKALMPPPPGLPPPLPPLPLDKMPLLLDSTTTRTTENESNITEKEVEYFSNEYAPIPLSAPVPPPPPPPPIVQQQPLPPPPPPSSAELEYLASLETDASEMNMEAEPAAPGPDDAFGHTAIVYEGAFDRQDLLKGNPDIRGHTRDMTKNLKGDLGPSKFFPTVTTTPKKWTYTVKPTKQNDEIVSEIWIQRAPSERSSSKYIGTDFPLKMPTNVRNVVAQICADTKKRGVLLLTKAKTELGWTRTACVSRSLLLGYMLGTVAIYLGKNNTSKEGKYSIGGIQRNWRIVALTSLENPPEENVWRPDLLVRPKCWVPNSVYLVHRPSATQVLEARKAWDADENNDHPLSLLGRDEEYTSQYRQGLNVTMEEGQIEPQADV